jgi:hypothetical protein
MSLGGFSLTSYPEANVKLSVLACFLLFPGLKTAFFYD